MSKQCPITQHKRISLNVENKTDNKTETDTTRHSAAKTSENKHLLVESPAASVNLNRKINSVIICRFIVTLYCTCHIQQKNKNAVN